MDAEVDTRQASVVLIVKFISVAILTTLAMFGLMTLVGVQGTWFKLWIACCCAIPVNVYGLILERRRSR